MWMCDVHAINSSCMLAGVNQSVGFRIPAVLCTGWVTCRDSHPGLCVKTTRKQPGMREEDSGESEGDDTRRWGKM
jgi:hypothetical protein